MSTESFNLGKYDIYTNQENIIRNASKALLYELAIKTEKQTVISDKGALIVYSGEKNRQKP